MRINFPPGFTLDFGESPWKNSFVTIPKWETGCRTASGNDFSSAAQLLSKHDASPYWLFSLSPFFKKYFIYLLLERGEGSEKERETNISVQGIHRSIASWMPPTGDLAYNPGMCSEWESNQQPFLQVGTQSTEPHQPGPSLLLFLIKSDLDVGRAIRLFRPFFASVQPVVNVGAYL